MTHSDETSTSKCIGNPITPICAVETVMACEYRSRVDLCKAVEDPAEQHWYEPFEEVDAKFTIKYSITSYRTIRSVPDSMRDSEWYKVGDVEIDMVQFNCWPAGSRRNCVWAASVYYVTRNLGDHWCVTAYPDLSSGD